MPKISAPLDFALFLFFFFFFGGGGGGVPGFLGIPECSVMFWDILVFHVPVLGLVRRLGLVSSLFMPNSDEVTFIS